MTRANAAVLGLAAASAVPSLLLALFAILYSQSENVGGLLGFSLLIWLWSALCIFAFGFLVLYTLSSFRLVGWIRWWSAIAAGAVLGLVAVMCSGVPDLWSYPIFGAIGGLSGGAFWLVWRLGHG